MLLKGSIRKTDFQKPLYSFYKLKVIMFRKFFIWIVKNLIVLLLVTLIFSAVALDLPSFVKGLFKDIFQYASPEAQKGVVGKLTITCSGLEETGDALQQEISKGPISLDFGKIGALCKDYSSGKINDREFFFNVIGSAVPDKLELPKASALERYNSIIETLNRNKIIYLITLVILFVLLYLLTMDVKLFITALTEISFSMGILILLPYAAIIAYDKLVGIDTTPILSSILQGSFSLDIKGIISVVLLMLLRTYTVLIIASGIAFLGIGIAGKVYIWKSRKESKAAGTETKKKSEKGRTEIKKAKRETDEDEEADKKDRGRKKSTQEILDELEEMHKNRKK